MCLVSANQHSNNQLIGLGADRQMVNDRLVELAAEDNEHRALGLHLMLKNVDDWSKHQVLSKVKKFRCGRHRCFITGRHVDCHYQLRHVMANKRDEDDRPGTLKFQRMVLAALEAPCKILLEKNDA